MNITLENHPKQQQKKSE